jgi:hypothetical protein
MKQLILFVTVFFLATTVPAQPFSLDKKIKPVKLQLKERKDWKGAKAVAAKGILNTEGDYYYVKGASMFQPIDIFLLGDDGRRINMEVVKNNWKDVQATASTADAADEIANIKIRTYGDFGIRVFAEEIGGNYQLLVNAGPDIKDALASPFVALKDAGRTTSAASRVTAKEKNKNISLVWILGGVVVIIITVLVFLLRKKNGTGILLIAILMHLGSFQQASAQRKGIEIDYEGVWEAVQGEKAEKLADKIKKLKEAMMSTKDLAEQYMGLGECLSMPSPPGMPSVPSFCPEEGEGSLAAVRDGVVDCTRCFTEARAKFNEVRHNLEQLRIIYKCTKDFSDKAIAFGDNASGIHGVSGMAWQAERAKIEGSVKRLKEAYDAKYADLLARLQQSMMELAVCEEEFGTPDWYDRYGYMFYEFVKEKYKRSGD